MKSEWLIAFRKSLSKNSSNNSATRIPALLPSSLRISIFRQGEIRVFLYRLYSLSERNV